MSVSGFAVRLFGRFTKGKRYDSLQESLRKARMPVSADVYAATCMLYSVFMIIPGILLGFLVARLLHLGFPFMLLLITLLSTMLGFLAYQLTKAYPAMAASDKTYKIDAALPYTVSFMHALSRSGATITDIFRELSTRPDVGEIQKEAQSFMRDLEYLGQDPLTALRNLARTTPSEKFKSFLEVLTSIIETGGETTPYFSAKVSEFQNYLREENKKTIFTLEFLAELYVILIAFSPLLFLTIFIFMGLLPSQVIDTKLLGIIVYVWIPIGSLMLAILLSTSSPKRVIGKARIMRILSPYREVTTIAGGAGDRSLIRQLTGAMWQTKLKRFLSNPFRALVRAPSYTLFFSVPIAMIYFLTRTATTSTLFITFMIVAVPYAIVFEFRSKRVSQIENALPDFLKSLSSASRSGLTLPRAMAVASTANLGPLTDEAKRAWKDIQWGSSANEALTRMERRIEVSDSSARAVTLIRKANEADENISDVVDIVMNDVETQRVLRKDRATSMMIYKVIIILTFVVFLATSYLVVDSFLSAGAKPPAGMTIDDLKTMFYHLLLIEGLAAGLIAAQMGEGDMRGGFKYAILMMFLTWLIFEFIIIPKPMRPPTPSEEAVLFGLPMLCAR